MKQFLDDNFLLRNRFSEILYHEYAKQMPVIDYHNHLPPDEIAADKRFENITRVWLNGDHYKWRAMRSQGVDESLVTGNAGDWEKFQAWAATVPYTLRNPLYHWTHLELQRYFGIHELLGPSTARIIYEETSARLKEPDFSVRRLLERMNVNVLCTTDDPIDSLEHHKKIRDDKWQVRVLPAFRPDKAMQVEDTTGFSGYLDKLEAAADVAIVSFQDYLNALEKRHRYFAANQCTLSDHGLEEIYVEPYTETELQGIFSKLRSSVQLTETEVRKFKSAMLYQFAVWDAGQGFVQQYHLGALRNNNQRKLSSLGADTGWDSIGDFPQARALSVFLNRLDRDGLLAKTVLYNLNPADNEVFATMIGNFNDGSIAGKVQWGSAWWFLDQKDGMTKQLNALSNMGMLSRFIGMLTDSRSFLSFPRHEYFRRILCNLFGEEIAQGELPEDLPWVGKVIQDICFHNAARYFEWDGPETKQAR